MWKTQKGNKSDLPSSLKGKNLVKCNTKRLTYFTYFSVERPYENNLKLDWDPIRLTIEFEKNLHFLFLNRIHVKMMIIHSNVLFRSRTFSVIVTPNGLRNLLMIKICETDRLFEI